MRTRGLALVLLGTIFGAAGASAATMKVRPDKPYVGEMVTIVITLDDPWRFPEDPRIDNFERLSAHECGRRDEGVYCVVGYALAAGDVVIHPLLYTDRRNYERRTQELRLKVLPSPANAPSIGEALAGLRRAGLTGAVIVPETKDTIAGDLVRVDYWLWGTSQRVRITPPTMKTFGAITEATWHEGSAKEIATLDGVAVWKTRVATLEFEAPAEPGVIEIPPMVFTGKDHDAVRTDRSGSVEVRTFRRVAAATKVVITAVPVRDMAIGSLRVTCESDRVIAGWPAVTMIVSGGGSLRNARPPRFETRPPVATLISTSTPHLDYGRQRLWTFAVHVRDSVQLPDLLFDYYDTERRAVSQLRCSFPPIKRQRGGARTEAAAATAVTRLPRARDFPGMIETLAALIAAIAAIAFVLAKRD